MTLRVVNEQPELPYGEPAPEARPEVTPAQMLAVMSAIASVLTLRAMLLLTLIGSFWLTMRAMDDPTVLKIWVVVIFNLLVIGPVAFLARRA